MTTNAAAELYLARHRREVKGRRIAIFNPHNKPVSELPTITGFNNGIKGGFLSARAIADDGTVLYKYACTNEGYMENDLGVLEGCNSRAHELYRQHYPDGYKMRFVGSREMAGDVGLQAAMRCAPLVRP